MGIQRDIRDNKIQRNLSGKILKTPPIISLDSTSGITKDGSNLVSSWKDENRPFKFRAPSGQEPTEDGDGVEFNGGQQLNGVGIDYTRNWQIEFWIKADWSLRHRFLTFGLSSGFPYYLAFNDYTVNVVGLDWYENGVILPSIAINSAVNMDDLSNTWVHFYVQFIDNQYTMIQNGIASLAAIDLFPTVKNTTISTIGRIPDLSINNFVGSIAAVKVGYDAKAKWRAWDSDLSQCRYTTGDQVFTPPTFPNTIL